MICQETANYKEERIVVRNPIYIIFVILYVILLLDFITSSHVQFQLDIYIMFVFIFVIYRLSHLFYTFIFVFIIVTTHEIFHIFVQCLSFDILYHHSHLFILDIFFI